MLKKMKMLWLSPFEDLKELVILDVWAKCIEHYPLQG